MYKHVARMRQRETSNQITDMVNVKVICSLIISFLIFNRVAASKKTRNVVILLADDGGFEIGAYRNRICQTPNIDRLASRAVLFNNAFTSASSCSPSRASILSGEPSHQNGMYGLHHGVHHFDSFQYVRKNALPRILSRERILTGIIGKKHVGPDEVYKFEYEQTEVNNPIMQVGRNITLIKLLVREFLDKAVKENRPFFLYVGFHDPHRCGHEAPEYGSFCERFGSGEEGAGLIPDWKPIYYQWDEIDLPYNIQDTEAARRDVAAQYTTISRLDQGVGLVLEELDNSGLAGDTLVIYTSDNGAPYPGGRTNLYDVGMREPLIVASPEPSARKNQVSGAMVSLLDLAPTMLDWFNITTATVHADGAGNETKGNVYSGKSLLPILEREPPAKQEDAVFASQTHHEVTMYYPMRAIRTRRYKLLHNINYRMPFPIDQDLYVSPTFQDLLNRTRSNQLLPWYKTLEQYYHRPQWELYDIRMDPTESRNLHGKLSMANVERDLRQRLENWQRETRDPWLCSPWGVLINDTCSPLDNGLQLYP